MSGPEGRAWNAPPEALGTLGDDVREYFRTMHEDLYGHGIGGQGRLNAFSLGIEGVAATTPSGHAPLLSADRTTGTLSDTSAGVPVGDIETAFGEDNFVLGGSTGYGVTKTGEQASPLIKHRMTADYVGEEHYPADDTGWYNPLLTDPVADADNIALGATLATQTWSTKQIIDYVAAPGVPPAIDPTGDVSGDAAAPQKLTINAKKVTRAQQADLGGTSRLIGSTEAAADAAEITLGANLMIASGVLSATAGGGVGDVVGPAGAAGDNIAVFDGATGKLIKDGGVAISALALAGHVHAWGDITSGLPTTLAGYGITDAQASDAFLTSIAALGTAADRMLYTTGVDTAAEVTTTLYGRGFLPLADAAAARTYIGAGTGSVSGTGTDNRLMRWDGTTGAQDSAVQLTDAGQLGGGGLTQIAVDGTSTATAVGQTNFVDVGVAYTPSAVSSYNVVGVASDITIDLAAGAWSGFARAANNTTELTTVAGNVHSSEIIAAFNDTHIIGNGTTTYAYGAADEVQIGGTATAVSAIATYSDVAVLAGATATTLIGHRINPSSVAGTIGTHIGLDIQKITGGSTNATMRLYGSTSGYTDFNPIAVGTSGVVAFPASGTLAVVGNPLSQFAATTSAQLAGVLSDETGYSAGALAVFNGNPTFGFSPFTGGSATMRRDTTFAQSAALAMKSGDTTAATGTGPLITWQFEDSTPTTRNAGNTGVYVTARTAGTLTGKFIWSLANAAASPSEVMAMEPAALFPSTTGGLTLGKIGNSFGPIYMREQSANPSAPTSSVEGAMYVKADNLVFQFNDAGTTRYLFIPLSGTGTTWTHDTVGP